MELDKVSDDQWEHVKQDHKHNRVPFLIIRGVNQKRAIQMGKIHDMLGGFYVWQEPRSSNINVDAYTISELPCAISDTRIWSNSSRAMANIRQVRERHREGQGDGPLTQKIIAKAINEGITKEMSDREGDDLALAAETFDAETFGHQGLSYMDQEGKH
jgi:hypothetical protein